jgi:TolB-like protein/Tfp pilus assembly protein PilF
MLTGERPFQGTRSEAVIYAILHERPVPIRDVHPEVPEALAQIVERLLHPDRTDRYPTAESVLADLRTFSHGTDQPPPRAKQRTGPTRWAKAGAAVLLIGLLVVVGLFASSGDDTIDAVAVLPLASLSENSDKAYFADGMTEELISTLGQIEALRVISRTSVMRYKATTKTLPEIAQELDVDAVVEGSVAQEGDQVRIQVRLVDGETEERLWARRFDRPVRNVLALQHEAARAIARAIEVSLTAEDQARLGTPPEVDPEAYDLYLKGVETLAGRTNVADRQAMSYLESSIAIDSTFAPAHAQLSIAYTLHAEKTSKANRSAERALQFDPSLSMAYVARGLAQQFYAWDWTGGEQAFRRAITLNPNNAEAYHELAQLLMRLGRFEEAIEAEQRALLHSPVSALYRSGLGEIYFFSRRYKQAIAELRKALDIEPDRTAAYGWLSWVYLYSGKHKIALREWKKSGNNWPLVPAYARMGRPKEALEQIEAINQKQLPTHFELVWGVVSAYAALGEKEQALDWLERAMNGPSWFAPYLKVWPGFDPLRNEPRFHALLERVGLD